MAPLPFASLIAARPIDIKLDNLLTVLARLIGRAVARDRLAAQIAAPTQVGSIDAETER